MSKRPKRDSKGKGSADSPRSNAVFVEPPAAPDPAVASAKAAVTQWAGRVERAVAGMEQVQQYLRGLSDRRDRAQRRLQDLRAEAALLAALKLEELKARREEAAAAAAAAAAGVAAGGNAGKASGGGHPGSRPGSSGKSRSGRKKSSIARAGLEELQSPPLSEGESPTAAAAQAQEDRKKKKLYNTIMAVYKSNPAAHASAHGHGTLPGHKPAPAAAVTTTVPSPLQASLPNTSLSFVATPATHSPLSASHQQPQLQLQQSSANSGRGTVGASALSNSITRPLSASHQQLQLQLQQSSANSGSGDPRRPRDVPLAVWEELLLVRAQRIFVEDGVARAGEEAAGQLEKFAILQEQTMVARYGLSSAFDTFVKVGGLSEEHGGPGAAAFPVTPLPVLVNSGSALSTSPRAGPSRGRGS